MGCIFLLVSCYHQEYSPLDSLKINQIQVLATHNSYKMAMDSLIMDQLKQLNPNQALSLDYQHPPLSQQLDLGIRKVEIDVFYDPVGGKYSHPAGIKDQQAAGYQAALLDTTVMNQPGFKVLHVQDIDFRTNCLTLSTCLQEIKDWSDAHPNHVPIAISFNTKEQAINVRPDFTVPLPFTSTAFDSLDAEVLSIIPKERIITPDDIRGKYETLEAAVLDHHWPTLESSRGKFLFVVNAGRRQCDIYAEGHPSLEGRLMFISIPPGSPESAFVFQNNPTNNVEKIQELVKAGYLVRTRADSGTKEARKGDYSRFEAALKSGAHFISTDYELEDERFGTGYRIAFPGGKAVVCNPVVGSKDCEGGELE